MKRRVGILALTVALGGVPLSGCTRPWTDGDAEATTSPMGVRGPVKVVQALPTTPLPADWPIRDTPSPYASVPRPTESPLRPASIAAPTGPLRIPVEEVPAAKSEPAAAAPAEGAPENLPAIDLRPQQHGEDALLAALRAFREKRPDDAREQLKDCDPLAREALLCLLPLAVRLSDGPADPANRAAIAPLLDQVHDLTAPASPTSLLRWSALRIDKMCFCRYIKLFGVYEPLPDDVQPIFQGGSEGRPGERVQVYAEVRNFTSIRQGDKYVTQMASWGEIYDYEGHKVGENIEFGCDPDVSRSPRQDYFINYQFSVPPNLPPGPYTLWIHVKDVLAQPSRPPVKRSLDFRVIAGTAARSSRGGSGLASR
jgi:hypothetical protein